MIKVQGPITDTIVPPDVFPDTLHSLHDDQEDLMGVTFPKHQLHEVVWTPHSTNMPEPITTVPKYVFLDTVDKENFQGDIRNKDLIEIFDTNKIWSDRTSRDSAESLFQDLKIWRDRNDSTYRYSLSFNITYRKPNEHVECPLLCFRVPATLDSRKKPRPVVLELDNGRQGSTACSPTREIRRRPTNWSIRLRGEPRGSFSIAMVKLEEPNSS
jgi:hypothetical protein